MLRKNLFITMLAAALMIANISVSIAADSGYKGFPRGNALITVRRLQ